MESDRVEIEKRDHELKHLQFVRVIALNALVCASNLYEYAKRNSGSLKSAVGTVENTVTSVVGPVYDKFKGVPNDLLVFLDHKVDEAVKKFDEHAPPSAKTAVSKARSLAQKTSRETQILVKEAQVGGPYMAIRHTATLYMQLLLIVLVRFWYFTNKITSSHVVAQMALPTITHWAQTYNKTIINLTRKGYGFFNYIPLVPIDEIANAYKQVEAEKGPACAPCAENKTMIH